jgi:hypothetical protein
MPSRVHFGWTEIDIKMECIRDGPTLTSKCKWPEINPQNADLARDQPPVGTKPHHPPALRPERASSVAALLATGLGRSSFVQMTAAPKNPDV